MSTENKNNDIINVIKEQITKSQTKIEEIGKEESKETLVVKVEVLMDLINKLDDEKNSEKIEFIKETAGKIARHMIDEASWKSEVSVSGMIQFDEDGTIDYLNREDNTNYYHVFMAEREANALRGSIIGQYGYDSEEKKLLEQEIKEYLDSSVSYKEDMAKIEKKEGEAFPEHEEEDEDDYDYDDEDSDIYYDSYEMDESEAEKYDAKYCLYTWQRDFEDDNECQYFKTLKDLKDIVLSNDDWVYKKELTWTLGDLRINLDDFIKNREAFDLLVDFINGRKELIDLGENKFGLKFDLEYEEGFLDKVVFSQEDFGFDYNGFNIICYINGIVGAKDSTIVSNSHLPLEFYNLLVNNDLIDEGVVVEINK